MVFSAILALSPVFSSLGGPPVGFVLDRGHHFHEPLHVGGCDAPADGVFELRQVTVDALRDLQAFHGRRDHERAAILGADVARDETAAGEAIEDARQRGALVREATMQLRDRRRRGCGEEREDVRFALRQAVVTQIGQIQADPVRRSMDGRDQTQ